MFNAAVSFTQQYADSIREMEKQRSRDAEKFLQQIDIDRAAVGLEPYKINIKDLVRVAFEAGWSVRDTAMTQKIPNGIMLGEKVS